MDKSNKITYHGVNTDHSFAGVGLRIQNRGWESSDWHTPGSVHIVFEILVVCGQGTFEMLETSELFSKLGKTLP